MPDPTYEQTIAEEIRDRASKDITKSKLRGIICVKYNNQFCFSHLGMGPGESLDLLRDMARYLKASIEKAEKETYP